MHSDGMLSCGPLQSEYIAVRQSFSSFIEYNKPLLSDTEIRQNVYKSLILNSVSLVSIYVFDLLLRPILREHQQHWFHRNIGWFYQVMWLLPVVGASLYLNVRFAINSVNSLLIFWCNCQGIWCTTIAKRTYLLQYGGRPVTSSSEPPTYTGLLRSIATSAYRFVMICTSVVVGFTFGRMPLIGSTLEFFFMCLVDA
jgi:etoposide-induced 2.4 mRNA